MVCVESIYVCMYMCACAFERGRRHFDLIAPHHLFHTGNCLYCFVTLKQGQEGSDNLTKELKTLVRTMVCVH